MHRFPNPGSNLDNFLNCFNFLYKNIHREEVFNLHDMQELLVSNGLISSSGTMGIEALLKGASKDLSRDNTYNQCKMYAELYRTMGWIQSGEKSLLYNFTLLGDHIAVANIDVRPLVESCFIGMQFPNKVIEVVGQGNLRPFATILKTMHYLDNRLSRDEMIFGPLSMSNDTDQKEFDCMCTDLKYFRSNPKDFGIKLREKLIDRKISFVTAKNYTRFPLGSLRWLNWAQPIRDKIHYKKTQNTYLMTTNGEKIAKEIINSLDLRVQFLPDDELSVKNLAFYQFYKSLINSGFDITPVEQRFKISQKETLTLFASENLLFSPFQVLERRVLANIFDISLPTKKRISVYSPEKMDHEDLNKNTILRNELKTTLIAGNDKLNSKNEFYHSVKPLLNDNKDIDIVKILKKRYINYTKENYYPLIGNIFRSMGIKCDIPPHGVNSRRWDAILLSEDDSIPIEIKSPTEELHLSVKAIRQALENKIILQSRKAEKNKAGTASLAIGFELPKSRAEVSQLITDIQKIYNIDVAVLGIDYLLEMSIACIRTNSKIEFSELTNKVGIING